MQLVVAAVVDAKVSPQLRLLSPRTVQCLDTVIQLHVRQVQGVYKQAVHKVQYYGNLYAGNIFQGSPG